MHKGLSGEQIMVNEKGLSGGSDELVELEELPTIKQAIDDCMGPVDTKFAGLDADVVSDVLNNPDYKEYQQDQVYRWIIRNFLLSSSVNGTLSSEKLSLYIRQASTPSGRERLAASLMLAPVMAAEDLVEMAAVDVRAYEEGPE